MTPRQGTWGELRVGSYMKDKNGQLWKVVAERDFHLQIQNREGRKVHLQPKPAATPVTIMDATEIEAHEAITTILGARNVAERKEPDGVWNCPPFPTHSEGAGIHFARSHLSLMHGMFVDDVRTIKGLVEAHEASHAKPFTKYPEHFHR